MKRKLLLVCCMCASALSFAQTKSTGEVSLSTNVKATLELNNTTSMAKLTLVGPNDRWFALQFGSFNGPPVGETDGGDGMMFGTDLVYWNNTTLVDARQVGISQTPSNDVVNNWTSTSTVNGNVRTIVATRPFVGDANDYTFNYADTTIDFAYARSGTTNDFTLPGGHGANRGYSVNVPFSVLGVEDFSLNASSVYPNPSKGNFTVTSKTTLETINIYTQTGAFVKTITVDAGATEVEVDAEGLSQGVYLLELQNASDKSWKKIIIN